MPEIIHTIANQRGLQVRLELFRNNDGGLSASDIVWDYMNYDGGGRSRDQYAEEFTETDARHLSGFLMDQYGTTGLKEPEREMLANCLAFTRGQAMLEPAEVGPSKELERKLRGR